MYQDDAIVWSPIFYALLGFTTLNMLQLFTYTCSDCLCRWRSLYIFLHIPHWHSWTSLLWYSVRKTYVSVASFRVIIHVVFWMHLALTELGHSLIASCRFHYVSYYLQAKLALITPQTSTTVTCSSLGLSPRSLLWELSDLPPWQHTCWCVTVSPYRKHLRLLMYFVLVSCLWI